MDDSFFGFDSSAPVEDDGGGGIGGGGGLEDSEKDYDALNDETFGKAINGDWENLHESYVRLDQSGDIKDDDGDSDFEINLSRVSIDDFDFGNDENEGRIQLDPSVWANPFKNTAATTSTANSNEMYGFYRNSDAILRQNISNSLPSPVRQPTQPMAMPAMPTIPPHKIMLLEDIERNIRSQQQQKQQTTQGIQKTDTAIISQTPQRPITNQPLPVPPPQLFPRSIPPPGMQPVVKGATQPPPIFPTHQLPPPPLQPPGLAKQMARLPPGFPAMPPPMLGPPPPLHLPPGGPLGTGMQRPPMPHNLPVALNNFAMHPNFNAIRQNMPPMQPHRMPPHLQSPHFQQTNVVQPPNNMTNNVNQFSQRLVQEIQQNHPMLPFNRFNNNNTNNNMMPQQHHHNNMMQSNSVMQPPQFHHLQQMQQQQHQYPNNGGRAHNNMNNHHYNQQQQHQQQQQQQQQGRSNGNLQQDDYDEYANLMSNREKQWLITIQLSQLNTGTPYIDDYYFTVFKDRKTRMKGTHQESKAHKDNQLNHPFSQPKGHAHLVLISMSNKNVINHHHHLHHHNNQRNNGQNIRERRTSESNKDNKEQSPRTYTPLQFENSLGKLQCGSVTAPRKIIDMDVVGSDTNSPFSTTIEISTQRKSRQILMHIETLYRIVLKMEDLENPTAIATTLIVKERKEKEKQLALEQQLDNIELKDNQGNLNLDSIGGSIRSSLSEKDDEVEDYDDLLPKLLAGLTAEKVAQMMTVRKGKTLLKRAIPLIKEQCHRWDVWYSIFAVLPVIVKKERDDAEVTLFAMFPEFKTQLQEATMIEVIKLGNCLTMLEKKIPNVLSNKFCISCIIVLILRAEYIYTVAQDAINSNIEMAWITFLTALVNSLSLNNSTQNVAATIENDVIKPLISHFSRFRDLKSQQLLAVLTQETI